MLGLWWARLLNFLSAIGSAPSGGGGSFESIATAIGTGSSDTVTFTSIPSTYQHLQLRFNTLSSAGALGSLRLTVNSDTGTNYSYHYLEGNGATVAASGSATSNPYVSGIPRNTSYPTVGIIDIHDYASTSKYKTIRVFAGVNANNTTNNDQSVILASNLWQSTSAINSIAVRLSGGNLTTSSTISLYGIKGA
jgi:hypothetical protein